MALHRDEQYFWVTPESLNPDSPHNLSEMASFLGIDILSLQRVFAMVLPTWESKSANLFSSFGHLWKYREDDGDFHGDGEDEIRQAKEILEDTLHVVEWKGYGQAIFSPPAPGVQSQLDVTRGIVVDPYSLWGYFEEGQYAYTSWLYYPNRQRLVW